MKEKIPETYDQRSLKLKKGCLAYIIFEPGMVEEILIKGKCTDGHGYRARRASTPGNKVKSIHTCNGYLTPNLNKAKREAFRQRQEEAENLNIRWNAERTHWLELEALLHHGLDGVIVWSLEGTEK